MWRVIELNNVAVAWMVEGKYANAIGRAKEALHLLRERHNARDQGAVNDDLPTNLESFLTVQPLYSSASFQLSVEDASPSNMFTMYHHAFLFETDPHNAPTTAPREQHGPSLLTAQLEEVVTAVLLFNWALFSHKLGLYGNTNARRDHLENAFQMYRLASSVNLWAPDVQQEQQQPHPAFVVLKLACLTNAGHILSHLGREGEGHLCLQSLELHLRHPVTARCISPPDFEFFASMVAVGLAPNFRAVAAAA